MLSTLKISSDLIIDASTALLALAVGFFSALLYVRITSGSSRKNGDDAEAARKNEEEANQAERANMAAIQLRDLAKNVAIDVKTHSSLMTDITGELGVLELRPGGSGPAVAKVVSKILTANSKLQDRLADAEKKIQNQAEEIRTQQSEARTDALTDLANRRAFDGALTRHVEIFRSQQRPLSLMLLDVDYFKKFNDLHGHQAGDEVLRRVGKTLSQVVKTSDIPCRYGGEEFALVMPSTKIAEAKIAAERIRKAIEGLTVEFEGKTLSVTVSVGVAEISPGEEGARLVRLADDALYFSKKAGRNCGHWHDGKQCLPVIDPISQKAAPTATQGNAASDPSNLISFKDLPDRAVFADELNRRISESHRFGTSLSVMHIQVGDYAKLENEYGNAAGLLLLDSVAQFIRTKLRDMDLLGKIGSGEFIVMLPGSSEREAKLVGSRMQKSISDLEVPLGDEQLRLEIRQGVSGVKPDDESQAMMARAKQVGEQAKKMAAPVG